MKLVFFSDNHRDRDVVDRLIEENPDADRVISLGDSEMREIELNGRGIIGVKGNYPFEPDFPDELNFIFDGWSFFMTHGHRYGVKMGLSRLYEKARSMDFDVVCFGHTHRAIVEEIDGIVFLNPGSLSFPKGFGGRTYAIVNTSERKLEIDLFDIDSKKVVMHQIYPRRIHGE